MNVEALRKDLARGLESFDFYSGEFELEVWGKRPFVAARYSDKFFIPEQSGNEFDFSIEGDIAKINWFEIARDERCNGQGRNVYRKILEENFRKYGCRIVGLQHNVSSRIFWEKMGFGDRGGRMEKYLF